MERNWYRFYLSFLGSGFIPFAPGTMGSLATIPLVYLVLGPLSFAQGLSLFFILTLSNYFVLNSYMNKFGAGEKDPKWVVQDEVSGFLLGALVLKLLPPDNLTVLPQLIVLFFLFRFFDIWKPYPANYFDRSEKINAIIHDDLVAGIYAGITSYFILLLFP